MIVGSRAVHDESRAESHPDAHRKGDVPEDKREHFHGLNFSGPT